MLSRTELYVGTALLLSLSFSTSAQKPSAVRKAFGSQGATALPEEIREAEDIDVSSSAGLFIGINDFEHMPRIPFAVDDAVDLAYMFAIELDLVRADHVAVVLEGDPANKDSRRYLAVLEHAGASILKNTRVDDNDVFRLVKKQRSLTSKNGYFVVSLATHGYISEGVYNLMTTDSQHNLPNTRIQAGALFQEIALAEAERRILLLDACRSITRGASSDTNLAEVIETAVGQAVISAAILGGDAYDDYQRENGVFTAALLDGLKGEAPAHNGYLITVETLAKYANDRVSEWISGDSKERRDGITLKVEKSAARIPLAVKPGEFEEFAAYKGKVKEGIGMLQGSISKDGPITGALFDRISAIISVDLPRPYHWELLEEILALDGGKRMERNLAWYFTMEFSPRHPQDGSTVQPGLEDLRPIPSSEAASSVRVPENLAHETASNISSDPPEFRLSLDVDPSVSGLTFHKTQGGYTKILLWTSTEGTKTLGYFDQPVSTTRVSPTGRFLLSVLHGKLYSYDLRRIRERGSLLEPTLLDANRVTLPVWSWDGSRVAYLAAEAEETYEVRVHSVRHPDRKPSVVYSSKESPHSFAWESGSGERIVVSAKAGVNYELLLISSSQDSAGYRPNRENLRMHGQAKDIWPHWSTRRDILFFVSTEEGRPALFQIKMNSPLPIKVRPSKIGTEDIHYISSISPSGEWAVLTRQERIAIYDPNDNRLVDVGHGADPQWVFVEE